MTPDPNNPNQNLLVSNPVKLKNSGLILAYLFNHGPVIGTNGAFSSLPLFQADSVNNNDDVAGSVYLSIETATILKSGGGAISLGTLPAPYNAGSFCVDINDLGEVAGKSYSNSGNHAFFYHPSTDPTDPIVLTDLGGFTDAQNVSSDAINNRSQIVGLALPDVHMFVNSRGVFWQSGNLYDLNDLVPSDSGMDIYIADDINDAGGIAASGYDDDGVSHALLLVPVQFQAQDGEINHGFDPRVGSSYPDGGPGFEPWASVVKGGVRDVAKIVIPAVANRIRLRVVADGDQPIEADVDQKDGFVNGDNDLELIGSTGTDSVTTCIIEAYLVDGSGNDTGQVVAKLHVMALPPRVVSLGIYRVADSQSPATGVPPTSPTDDEILCRLNDIFSQAGISFVITDSQSLPNIRFDTYSSPKISAGDGLVQEEEFDTISALIPMPAATARLILANRSGDALNQDDMPPYVRGDSNRELSSSIVFTVDSGQVSDLVATHEIGHLLALSVVSPPSSHDPGPFPSATLATFGGLMHAGEVTDQPGLWIAHQDWQKANETASLFAH